MLTFGVTVLPDPPHTRFLELMPDDVQAPLAHIRLGAVLLKRERMDDAARSFARALEMRPNDPHALEGYAQALAQLDRIPEAVEAFGRLVVVSPQDARERAVGVLREGLRDYLDSDLAVQFGIGRAVNLAHSAGAQRRTDLVLA